MPAALLLVGVAVTLPELEDVPCPIGCSAGDAFVLEGCDLLQGLPGRFRVVRCRGCGLMRTNPRPTTDAMACYYPDDYGPYVGTRIPSPRRSKVGALVARVLGANAQALPNLAPGRALEIGCASGSFLRYLADAGWDVEGVEFSESAAAASRRLGFTVHAGALEDAPDPEEPFDLCVGWMVLEHLHSPVTALRKLRGWTRPGGWLAVSMPDAGALEFSIFRDRWYALHLPNHLVHANPATATRLLRAGGWRVVKIIHQRSIAYLIGSLGLLLRKRGWAARLADRMVSYPESPGGLHRWLLPLSWVMAALGQTGKMTIWARREESSP